MTKTFDEICKSILGETIMSSGTPAATQKPGQPTTPPQQQTKTSTQNQPVLSDEQTQLLIKATTPEQVTAAWTKINAELKNKPTQPTQPATSQQNAAKGV